VSQFHPGSYGWLVRATVNVTDHPDLLGTLAKTGRVPIRFEVSSKASHRGGLAIFGAAAGRYPLDPTLIITFAEDHQLVH
jgi:predicted transcriptional regulator